MKTTQSQKKKRGFMTGLAISTVTLPAELVRGTVARPTRFLLDSLAAARASFRVFPNLTTFLDETPSPSFAAMCAKAGIGDEQIASMETRKWAGQAFMLFASLALILYAASLVYRGQLFSALISAIFAIGCWVHQLRAGWIRAMLRERQMLSLRAALSKGAAWPL